MNTGSHTTEGGQRAKRTGKRRQDEDTVRVSQALEDARESLQNVADDIRQRVEEHPWRALAVAAGAGYIVGGGLFSRLTGGLLFGGLRMGLRLAALPFVRDEVFAFIDTLSTERRQRSSANLKGETDDEAP